MSYQKSSLSKHSKFNSLEVQIFQGSIPGRYRADLVIVVDVLRAFTTTHMAFLCNADRILCVQTIDRAFKLQDADAELILVGEKDGYPISGFDFGNSPAMILEHDLTGKSVVLRTTNGVRALLDARGARHVVATGMTNLPATVGYVHNCALNVERPFHVNIVASDPRSDEDLACAELLQDALLGGDWKQKLEGVRQRVRDSSSAEKFRDPQRAEFSLADLSLSLEIYPSEFAMVLDQNTPVPALRRATV